MRKNLKRIQYFEQLIFDNELSKMKDVEMCYKKRSFFNSMSILFFIMGLIIIITAAIYQSLLINTNDILITLFIGLFMIISLLSLLTSMFYNSKTINLVNEYYNKVS